MSSEVGERLHSVVFQLYRRLFALLLAWDAARVLWNRELGLEVVLRAGAFLALSYWLWFRARTVFATKPGLELRLGVTVRKIAWQDVADVREMPWMTLHPPWYPKLYQVDLVGGEAFDFVGRRDARAIVIKAASGVARTDG
jgi:hypothetical protein